MNDAKHENRSEKGSLPIPAEEGRTETRLSKFTKPEFSPRNAVGDLDFERPFSEYCRSRRSSPKSKASSEPPEKKVILSSFAVFANFKEQSRLSSVRQSF